MPGNPSGRHERGHGYRQHRDLGRETSPRRQIVEQPAQRELGEAAGDEEDARKGLGGREGGAQWGLLVPPLRKGRSRA